MKINIKFFLVLFSFLLFAFQVVASKPVSNYPYVYSDLGGRFYVRCIPDGAKGEKGTTILYRVKRDNDQIINKYNWYSRQGVILGWSPIVGKVAIMKKGGLISSNLKKQVEFSFYLDGKHLKTYTTQDLLKMGAQTYINKVNKKKQAKIMFQGCQQIYGTNDYVFVVQLSNKKKLLFNILTGKLYNNN